MSRSEKRQALRLAWTRFLPILDCALSSDWSDVSGTLKQTDFPRSEFLSFVSENDLSASFYGLVTRDRASGCLPSWFVLHLLATVSWGRLRRKELEQSLARFSAGAEKGGVKFLLLKGMQFGQRFYPSADDRWSRDLDVLVHANDQVRVARVLKELGYHAEKQAWLTRGIRNRLAHARNWQKDQVSIDLHHDFRVGPAYRMDVERVFHDAQAQRIAGIEVLAPCDEDCLLLFLVSMLSDIEQGRVRGKTLVDFHTLLTYFDGRLDWRAFLEDRVGRDLSVLINQAVMLFMASLPRSCQFPAVLDAIKAQMGGVTFPDPRQAVSLLSAPQYSLANRRWYLRHYQGGKVHYLAWWLIGGIFRSGSVMALVRALK